MKSRKRLSPQEQRLFIPAQKPKKARSFIALYKSRIEKVDNDGIQRRTYFPDWS